MQHTPLGGGLNENVPMQARRLPSSHAEVVDFFLETEGGEMEFEAARCRPMLTPDFFAYLKQQIGERGASPPCKARCMGPPPARSACRASHEAVRAAYDLNLSFQSKVS
jgi:hypothetical protein